METKPKPHPIRARFRELREENYTQAEAAEKIGMSRAGYSYFENRPQKPQMALVHRFARKLGIDMEKVKDC
jgi:DNA-binding XRE family transcriptional regulator